MPLVDSMTRFRLHLVSLPELHYAGTCQSEYSCPVAYWLCCETNEWVSVRVTDEFYCIDIRSLRPQTQLLPFWAFLFIASVDSQRWHNGRHMTREEALYVLNQVEREVSRRLLPERAESQVAWENMLLSWLHQSSWEQQREMWLTPIFEEFDQWLSCK